MNEWVHLREAVVLDPCVRGIRVCVKIEKI
jgi:hypothetical protein